MRVSVILSMLDIIAMLSRNKWHLHLTSGERREGNERGRRVHLAALAPLRKISKNRRGTND
jgi:hypothetical protein